MSGSITSQTNTAGAVCSITITSRGTGYTTTPVVSLTTPIGLATPTIHSALTILNSYNEPLLMISRHGDIKFNGPPSQAADRLLQSLGGAIDRAAAGKLAMDRSYRRAIEKCLRLAQRMEKDEYIAMLEQELQTRQNNSVLMALRDIEEEDL